MDWYAGHIVVAEYVREQTGPDWLPKMAEAVAEALNILSEDMRLNRFRRGEQIALKAPLKMLVPLLLFIFPTVGVLIAGPIFLDFILNNPIKAFGQ